MKSSKNLIKASAAIILDLINISFCKSNRLICMITDNKTTNKRKKERNETKNQKKLMILLGSLFARII